MKKKDEYLVYNKEALQLKVGEMIVEMQYSDHRKMEECVLNILKQKRKIG